VRRAAPDWWKRMSAILLAGLRAQRLGDGPDTQSHVVENLPQRPAPTSRNLRVTTTSTTEISPATAGTRGRTARVAAGVLAVLWTLFVLPPQVLDWSGRRGTFRWVVTQYDALGYLRLEGWLADRGLDDTYIVFGVAIVLSILLTWWAMRP